MKERDLILETIIVSYFETYEYDEENGEYDYDSPIGEEEKKITLTIDTDFNFYFEGVWVDINGEDLFIPENSSTFTIINHNPEDIIREEITDWFGEDYPSYITLFDDNFNNINDLINSLEPLYKGHLRSKKLELLGI